MLFEHSEHIKDTLEALREDINLLVIRMSEDKRNLPICDRLRAVRDGEIKTAYMYARSLGEDNLEKAMQHADNALVALHTIIGAINLGYNKPGSKTGEEALTVYPLISEPYNSPCYAQRGYDGSDLQKISRNTYVELTSYGAELDQYAEIVKQAYPNLKMLPDDKCTSHFIYRLKNILYSTQQWLTPYKPSEPQITSNIDDNHPSYAAAGILERMCRNLDPFTGFNGWGILPKEGRSPEEAFKNALDHELKEIHVQLQENAIKPPRNSEQCVAGVPASIHAIKRELRRTANYYKEHGASLPEYDAAVERGRGL